MKRFPNHALLILIFDIPFSHHSVFYRKKKDVKKTRSIDKQKRADKIFAEKDKHQKSGERVQAQEKLEDRYGTQWNRIAFAAPSVLLFVYSVFGGADETAFHV
jgi:hypothetical protein